MPETDEKVVELVSAGTQKEEIEKVREAARVTTLNRLDRVKTAKIGEFYTILASDKSDEETQAQQSIIRQYLGAHLLDPSQPPPDAGANVFP